MALWGSSVDVLNEAARNAALNSSGSSIRKVQRPHSWRTQSHWQLWSIRALRSQVCTLRALAGQPDNVEQIRLTLLRSFGLRTESKQGSGNAKSV